MRLGVLLVLAAVPFLEIALLIKVGQSIGFLATLALVLLSAALGFYVIYEQGLQVFGRAMETMRRGKPPVAPVIDGLFILLAGVLLIVPGFLSDAAGLALLVPYWRHRFAVWCLRRVVRSADIRAFFSRGQTSTASGAGNDNRRQSGDKARSSPFDGEGPIIEGEFERIDERTVDRSRGTRQDEKH